MKPFSLNNPPPNDEIYWSAVADLGELEFCDIPERWKGEVSEDLHFLALSLGLFFPCDPALAPEDDPGYLAACRRAEIGLVDMVPDPDIEQALALIEKIDRALFDFQQENGFSSAFDHIGEDLVALKSILTPYKQ